MLNTFDALYENPYVMICTGLLVASVVAVIDEIDICYTSSFWGIACLILFIAGLLCESNALPCFMIAALVANMPAPAPPAFAAPTPQQTIGARRAA